MRGKNNTGIGLWTQYELAERSFFFSNRERGERKNGLFGKSG